MGSGLGDKLGEGQGEERDLEGGLERCDPCFSDEIACRNEGLLEELGKELGEQLLCVAQKDEEEGNFRLISRTCRIAQGTVVSRFLR